MVGVLPKKGPASISERAGWTDQICFYQLGKKPPLLVLADFPGYGHAGRRHASLITLLIICPKPNTPS